jgi:cystathionine beta-synthase
VNDPNACVVTFLCDTGERYLTKLYSDEWMRENQMLDQPRTTLAQLLDGKHGAAPMTVVSVAPAAPVRQALRLMTLHDISQLPVMENGNCVGSVSESGLSAAALEDVKVLDKTVADVMDPAFPTVESGQTADAIVKVLSKANPAVLVRDNGTVRGIVTRSDLLAFLMAR